MKSLFNSQEAAKFKNSALELRAYTSRLLGLDESLVLHGGGNTSVKISEKNIFAEPVEILYVKGSGHNLQTIGPNGFAPCNLETLKKLALLDKLSDTEMVRELKVSMTNPSAPSPSVETILHAVIPFKFVDHTHADAVVTISNTPDGEERLRSIYGKRALILPFCMPGFDLAKQIYLATVELDWKNIDSIILRNHGVFTFSDDACESYENMISTVNLAEDYLKKEKVWDCPKKKIAAKIDYVELATIRKTASDIYKLPMILKLKTDELSVGYSSIENIDNIATRGPLTPDHVIQTKRIPMLIEDDARESVNKFANNYRSYFEKNNNKDLQILDQAPRVGVWKNRGLICLAPNNKRAVIVSDLLDHTIVAVQRAEGLKAWQVLDEKCIFDLEYWELEQAKLKSGAARKEFEGKVVIISGAASGIGQACVNNYLKNGACVVGLDIDAKVLEISKNPEYLGLICDVTKSCEIKKSLEKAVTNFGGVDILISNAGAFPASSTISNMEDDNFERSLTLNLSSHMKVIREASPFLELGVDPSIIIIASKNVPAPGPGASAYSAAKAGLTQLGRVAALEMGAAGVRVNMIHPNAVFDTGVWTEEVLAKRAKHYGLSIKEYKENNILKTEVTSQDVAKLVSTISGANFSKTTGAQIPVDGGNERVI